MPTSISDMTKQERADLKFNIATCLQIVQDADKEIKKVAANSPANQGYITIGKTSVLGDAANSYYEIIEHINNVDGSI